ncbi:MAG: undecaprenyldiphospho-muramoylpentapeptide beta-N-acetylglucosaminyltransferase [Elusimicrobiota bacterium]
MKVLIAVSGTGGHIYPGLAIADAAAKNNDKVILVGNKGMLTQNIIMEKGYELFTIPMTGWQGRSIGALIKALVMMIISFFKSLKILKNNNPDVVLGMGGYISIPVILAAYFLRKTVILHEQNCYPGLANRVLAKFAKTIAVGFSDSKKYFTKRNVFVTGIPVRSQFYSPDNQKSRTVLGIKSDKKIALVYGGSQGAHRLNALLLEAIKISNELRDNIYFIHITGNNDFEWISKEYKKLNSFAGVYKYLPDIYNAFACCDFLICRSGASTCFEILVSGKPALVVPFPYATDNHQLYNAQYLRSKGIAIVSEEKELTAEKLAENLTELIHNKKYIINAQNVKNEFEKIRPEKKVYDILKNSGSKI